MKRFNLEIAGREIPLGLSAALCFLWLPLMTPHILSAWQARDTLWALRGLPILFAVIAGFSVTLLVERFVPKASLRRRRFWVCTALMLLTPVFLFLPLPPLAGLLGLFLSAACTAVLLLPALQTLRGDLGNLRPVLVAIAAGCCLAAAGQPVLNWFSHAWPQLYALPVVAAAGALLTGGMAVSRRVKPQPADASDLCVPVERARGTKLFAFRCAGLSLSCVGTLLMIADLFASRQENLPLWNWLAPPLLLAAAGLLCAATLWDKRWLFLYVTALGVLLGGLMLSSEQTGPPVYVDMFLLFLGVVGLGLMSLESLSHMVAPVNRTFAMGLGGAVFFWLVWMAADPAQLLYIGIRLQRPGADLPLMEGLFLLLPLLIGFRDAAGRAETRVETIRPADAGEQRDEPRDQLYDQLTATEKKVYQLILMGYANQQMADTLYVSINTIKFHVKNILSKAGVTKKSQLLGPHIHRPDGDGGAEKLS